MAIDLEILSGECFGLLGPNGAGKTTTIEICEGLTEADSGEVEVLGLRWSSDAPALRQKLGIQLQETQLAEKLTVFETLRLFRSFFRQGPGAEEAIRTGPARRKARRARGCAFGRAEAAAGVSLRAGRRSGFAVPRRTDHGSRSAGPPSTVGPDRGVQGGRPYHPADHALHGRGRTAVRPRGHHGSRQNHRAGHAARADRVHRRGARGRILRRKCRRARSGRCRRRWPAFATSAPKTAACCCR